MSHSYPHILMVQTSFYFPYIYIYVVIINHQGLNISGSQLRFQMEAWGNSSGQPLGLDFDSQGVAFVCDAAHQAIFRILRVRASKSQKKALKS